MSMEERWLGGEVGSGGRSRCRQIGLVGGRGETRLYKIVSPTKPKGCHTLSVGVIKGDREVNTNSE